MHFRKKKRKINPHPSFVPYWTISQNNTPHNPYPSLPALFQDGLSMKETSVGSLYNLKCKGSFSICVGRWALGTYGSAPSKRDSSSTMLTRLPEIYQICNSQCNIFRNIEGDTPLKSRCFIKKMRTVGKKILT